MHGSGARQLSSPGLDSIVYSQEKNSTMLRYDSSFQPNNLLFLSTNGAGSESEFSNRFFLVAEELATNRLALTSGTKLKTSSHINPCGKGKYSTVTG